VNRQRLRRSESTPVTVDRRLWLTVPGRRRRPAKPTTTTTRSQLQQLRGSRRPAAGGWAGPAAVPVTTGRDGDIERRRRSRSAGAPCCAADLARRCWPRALKWRVPDGCRAGQVWLVSEAGDADKRPTSRTETAAERRRHRHLGNSGHLHAAWVAKLGQCWMRL